MIQNHCENSCNSNAVSSPIKNPVTSDTDVQHDRNKEQYKLTKDNTNVTFRQYSESELLQGFLGQNVEQFMSILATDKFDNFVSDANSGYEQLDELENGRPLPLTPENYPNSVITNEYSCSSNQTNKDITIIDMAHNSDASNPHEEICKEEEDLLPSDEPYSYLQGLNSDNLMQFSQQSAIQELLMKEQLDVKPNLDVLPTFEEHDTGGYKFDLQVCSRGKAQKGWMFSSTRKKLYIRMNDIFTVDVIYVPKLPLQQLRVRVLMSFKNEVSEPVLRCQNHLSKDTESHPKRRQSLLRCENPSAEYCGTPEGKSIHDRYSVLIPLGASVIKNDNTIRQTIAIKFTCQNSCIGRKETSLIFLLEGMSGEILSQRVMDVKICCCPKRDHKADERNRIVAASKRKSNEDMSARAPKLKKKKNNTQAFAKDEDTSSDLEDSDSGFSTAQDVDLQATSSGNYRVVIELDKELMQKALECFNQAIALRMFEEPQQAKHYNKMCRKLMRVRDKLKKV
ncbi:uncharacterized protein LOC118737029 isoform X2 [Rhagoletis pomonella]|uniref:uncharacterized protein LOC118737029 isoform X2 n=1 Tax=Rhagoletis pomonella TaxID=28610 RepID=UPI00177BC268|nr:uncharacterized protein LOC118737029 isoform X2 [Rhagoletis pomonella]